MLNENFYSNEKTIMSNTLTPHPPDAGPAKPMPRDPRRWLTLAVMSIGTLVVFLDLTVVNTALPSIAVDLGATTSELQWVVDAYVIVLAGLLLLAGSIGDRYGRRNWMSAGLVVFGVGSVVGGLASNIETLITARALQGLGAAFVLPATLSIITNTFERDERGKAIAIWTAVGGMGIGLGPAVGGFLIDSYDWSAAFWLFVPVVAVGLLGMTTVQESKDNRHIGLDLPGALAATAGISALVFAIIESAERGWSDPLILSTLVGSAVMLALFITIEQRVDHPMLPLHFFKERDFTGSVVVIGLMFFAGPAAFFFLTQFFQIVQGRDPFEAGLLILPNAGAIIAASIIAPKALDVLGPRRITMVALTIMAAGAYSLTTLDAGSSGGGEIARIMLFGFGFGLAMPALTDAVMAAVPVEDAGVGSAVNDVSRELGSALGVAVIGSYISRIYRGNVTDNLDGVVDADVVETAKDGIGSLLGALPSLDPATGDAALAGAGAAFIDAMTDGFMLSVAVLMGGVAIANFMLPNKQREIQAERLDIEIPDPSLFTEWAIETDRDDTNRDLVEIC